MAGASTGLGIPCPAAAESGSAPRGAAGAGRAAPEDAAGGCRCPQLPTVRDILAQGREQPPPRQLSGREQASVKQQYQSGAGAPLIAASRCLPADLAVMAARREGAGMGQRQAGEEEGRRRREAARGGIAEEAQHPE